MTDSRTSYAFVGGTFEYLIGFDYLDPDWVELYVDGSLVAQGDPGWEITSDGLRGDLTNVPGLAGGEALEFRRATSVARKVVFQDGSSLRAADLDVAQRQNLHVAAEGRDAGGLSELHTGDGTIHVPAGGSLGDVLAKASATDGDTSWTPGSLVTVPAAPEGGLITWPDGADADTQPVVIQGSEGQVPTVQANGSLAFAAPSGGGGGGDPYRGWNLLATNGSNTLTGLPGENPGLSQPGVGTEITWAVDLGPAQGVDINGNQRLVSTAVGTYLVTAVFLFSGTPVANAATIRVWQSTDEVAWSTFPDSAAQAAGGTGTGTSVVWRGVWQSTGVGEVLAFTVGAGSTGSPSVNLTTSAATLEVR